MRIAQEVRKLKYRLKHDFLAIENVILVVAVAMCLTWTYQSVVAMDRNWRLTEQLNTERQNLELMKIEVETAELTNEYLASEEYQELAARRLLEKKLPGEHMVVLPENSEAAKSKHSVKEVAASTEEPKEYSNFEKWVRYLFR
ncbi:hypothetical protein IJ135_01530 [Candidatus Saccharibacteria bacterium]|nr:hypothetical protein [Candidatus Saccharibacteria bacterium]